MSPCLATRLIARLSILCAALALQAPVLAEEILYIHNTLSGEVTKVALPEHEVIGQIPIGLH